MPTDPLVVRALLRKHLPRDIRLRAVAPVPHDFHAQFNSRGKQYRYHLALRDHQGPQPRLAWALPDEERTAYLQPRFDQRRFQQALEAMKGRRTFAGAMADSAKQGISHLYESRIVRQVDNVHGRRLTLSFQADRFGKYMIRTLVGIAVRCAWGELDVGTLAARLDAEEPLTQLLAPPQGLALWKVLYQPDPFPWLR
jgi:tRNA pseudouridine38-40 synthase